MNTFIRQTGRSFIEPYVSVNACWFGVWLHAADYRTNGITLSGKSPPSVLYQKFPTPKKMQIFALYPSPPFYRELLNAFYIYFWYRTDGGDFPLSVMPFVLVRSMQPYAKQAGIYRNIRLNKTPKLIL